MSWSIVLVLAIAASAMLALALAAGFRGEDWLELEIGLRTFAKTPPEIWRGVDAMGLFRPVTNAYHGSMLRAFGLAPAPHFVAAWVWFAAIVAMLARVAALRGAPPAAAWLVAGAAWVQANTYAWSLLWAATMGRTLAIAGWMAALLLHHLAVRRAARGVAVAPALAAMATCFVFALLAKEEAVVLVPLVVVLEAVRWSRLTAPERRAVLASVALLAALAAAYAAFRLGVVPVQIAERSVYRPRLGMNYLVNLAFLAGQLALLPAVVGLVTRLLYPAAWRHEARVGEDWDHARGGMIAGLAWAAVVAQPYLLLGQHSWGYLFAPGLGVALAAGTGLEWASRQGAAGAAPRRASPAVALAIHGVLIAALVGYGLQAVGWPRYRGIAQEAFAVLRGLELPPGARLVFLDPDEPETLSGRSLFNMTFDNVPGSMVRLALRRPDLDVAYVRGPRALDAAARRPADAVVLLARQGRLTPVTAAP